MRIDNFQLKEVLTLEGSQVVKPQIAYATVDVHTGPWFWRKTEVVQVFKTRNSLYWQYLDSGEFIPGHRVEQLAEAYQAQTKQLIFP